MKITVKVMPHAKKEEVILQGGVYLVRVKAVAREGKANDAVVRLLAVHFDVPRGSVQIKSGFTSRNKIIDVVGR